MGQWLKNKCIGGSRGDNITSKTQHILVYTQLCGSFTSSSLCGPAEHFKAVKWHERTQHVSKSEPSAPVSSTSVAYPLQDHCSRIRHTNEPALAPNEMELF